jgi:hypothetical protein
MFSIVPLRWIPSFPNLYAVDQNVNFARPIGYNLGVFSKLSPPRSLSLINLCAEGEHGGKGCQSVLEELQRVLDKNTELKSEPATISKRINRVWKRLKWDQDYINELRDRISRNIGLLNALNGRIIQDNVVKLAHHQESQESQAALNWITPIDYAPQQNDFINRRYETASNTCTVYFPNSLLYAVCLLLTYMLKTMSGGPNSAWVYSPNSPLTPPSTQSV